MPRKAKPPAYTVQIEGLSKLGQVKDDLGDATISVPTSRVPTYAELSRIKAQAKLQASQRILALMWPEPKPRSNAKPGERSIKLGQGHELILQTPSWRRF